LVGRGGRDEGAASTTAPRRRAAVRRSKDHASPGVKLGRGVPALFLASPLSAFVTGTTIHVDGGTLAAAGWYPRRSGGWTNRPLDP